MTVNQQQTEAWNGGESVHYVDHADRYDRQLAPVTEALLQRARLDPAHRVLDVGCGCGAMTIAAAGSVSSALGADISEPLTEVATARARAASVDNVEFVVTDAQVHVFTEAAFDTVISQFGLMFFDDPVRAFTNLRRAIVPGGRLVFACWQGIDANDWLSLVGRAVEPFADVPDLGGQAGGPGMFALKHPAETTALLEAAGFSGVEVESYSPDILMGGGGTVDDTVRFLMGMGIVRGLLGRLEGEERETADASIRSALVDRYEPGVGVRIGAGVWLVTAHND